jgi:hypothetical protein
MAVAGEMVALDIPDRVRGALALRSQGKSWRAVADALGLTDHTMLYAECRSWDAVMRGDERWKALAGQAIEIAQEAGAQLQEALLARAITPGQLPVTYGIAVDKVVNMRRAEQPERGAGGGLGALLEALHAGGGKVTATLELAPAAVDVTAKG